MIPAGIMECSDYSEFQESLKAMRKPHDAIVSTINKLVPTDSFHADEVAACKNLYESLEQGNTSRTKSIKNCISITADKVKNLKEQREANSNNSQLAKELRAEQTKLRMLQVELSVEDMIQQRTSKVFSDRCRRFYKPS